MRHNDYPATLLMEQPEPETASRYRMTPAASTVRFRREDPTSAELTAAEDYWHDCHRFERMDHALPTYRRRELTGVWIDEAADIKPEVLAQLASTESAASGAALVDKSEPEAEVWHTEAPTVAGDYIASSVRDAKNKRYWDGAVWHESSFLHQKATRCHPVRYDGIEWLRLIEADTPAPAAQIPDWRHGDKVLQNERTGLWHLKDRDGISPARRHDRLLFWPELIYRPAAPGVCEGDYYDESRYSLQA